jgi:hypothetical protein
MKFKKSKFFTFVFIRLFFSCNELENKVKDDSVYQNMFPTSRNNDTLKKSQTILNNLVNKAELFID